MTSAATWLERIRSLELPRKIKIMNVCGGHERSITLAGMRGALPQAVELIPGPGCPVCVCPEEDIYQAIQLAMRENVMLLAFGDMLRVPVNVPKSQPASLEQAKAAGAQAPLHRRWKRLALPVPIPKGPSYSLLRDLKRPRPLLLPCWLKGCRTICLSCCPAGLPGPQFPCCWHRTALVLTH